MFQQYIAAVIFIEMWTWYSGINIRSLSANFSSTYLHISCLEYNKSLMCLRTTRGNCLCLKMWHFTIHCLLATPLTHDNSSSHSPLQILSLPTAWPLFTNVLSFPYYTIIPAPSYPWIPTNSSKLIGGGIRRTKYT